MFRWASFDSLQPPSPRPPRAIHRALPLSPRIRRRLINGPRVISRAMTVNECSKEPWPFQANIIIPVASHHICAHCGIAVLRTGRADSLPIL